MTKSRFLFLFLCLFLFLFLQRENQSIHNSGYSISSFKNLTISNKTINKYIAKLPDFSPSRIGYSLCRSSLKENLETISLAEPIAYCGGYKDPKAPHSRQKIRNSKVFIQFNQLLLTAENRFVQNFKIKSDFQSPLLQISLSWRFLNLNKSFKKSFLSDGSQEMSKFLPESAQIKNFSLEKKNGFYELRGLLPFAMNITERDDGDVVLIFEVSLEYQNVRMALQDDYFARIPSFVGSKSFSSSVSFKTSSAYDVQLIEEQFQNWFISDSNLKNFSFNFENDENLQKSCKNLTSKIQRASIRKKEIIEISLFGDSQPFYECLAMPQQFLLPIEGRANYFARRCKKVRYPTNNVTEAYFDVYKHWLVTEVSCTSKSTLSHKLLINFSGLHDNYCAILGAFEQEKKYQQVIKNLLQVTSMLIKENEKVEAYIMSTTAVKNHNSDYNWPYNQIRVEFINKVVESEIKQFDNLKYIDVGYYTKVFEGSSSNHGDVLHFTKHTNHRILDLILCHILEV